MALQIARSISSIYTGLVQGLITSASTVGIVIVPTNWSITDYKRLILNTVAEQIGVLEQLFDSHVEDIEDTRATLPPVTKAYLQDRMKNLFEYDSIQVPIIQLNTNSFTFYYPNPNPNFRIVKYCSVVPTNFGSTIVKIATETGGLPSQITSPALDAAQTFINTIAVDGINYYVQSKDADRVFMQLDVFYNGLYASVIETNVISAIEAFFATLSTTFFDGVLKASFLKQAILDVEGVNDCTIDNLKPRADAETVGTGTDMILNNTELLQPCQWQSVAGYLVLEDTTGANWTLTDFRVGSSGIKNLNLIPQ